MKWETIKDAQKAAEGSVEDALNSSIRHYRNFTECTFSELTQAISEGITGTSFHNCALCLQFRDGGCEGCPVYEYTHQRYCHGSPYINASRQYLIFKAEGTPEQFARFVDEAKKELLFLQH